MGHKRNKTKIIRRRKPWGYWTREKVVQKLRDLAKKYGEDYLLYVNLRKNESKLFAASLNLFGSLSPAVEKAGHDYEKICGRKLPGYWTREKVVQKLRALAAEHGESYLSSSNLKEKECGLLYAARATFGSLKKAVKEAGYNYEEIIRKKPAGYWTKKTVIEEIRKLADKHGKSYLHPSNLHEKESSLLKAASKIFGSFVLALQEAGFDYGEVYKTRPHGYWTREKIIERLGALAAEHGGGYLRPSNLRKKESDLFNAIWRTFGSFKEPIEEAGHNYNEITRKKPKGYWTKGKVINGLRALAAEHGKSYLRPSNLQEKEGDLLSAASVIFGSFKTAVKKTGYDYEKIIGKKPHGYWTKEKIIKELRALAEEHGESYLNQSNLEEKESKLLSAAFELFGSLKAAVEAAGYDYKKIKKPMYGIPKIWKAWETCCGEIAEEIFGSGIIKFKETIKGTRFRPEIQVPSKNLIADAKLNAWDRVGIDRDIDNYINYCEKLEFWCLQGHREITSGIEIVTVQELLKRLKDAGAEESKIKEFRKKVILIKRGIDPYKDKQKEIRTYFP